MSLTDTLKPLLGAGLDIVKQEVIANAPAEIAALGNAETIAVDFVAGELEAAIPTTSLIQKAAAGTLKSAINTAAAKIVAQAGGANALILAKIEDELGAIAAQYGG